MYRAATGEIIYSNPISDLLNTKTEREIIAWIQQSDKAITLEEESDKGFLDFLAGIEKMPKKWPAT